MWSKMQPQNHQDKEKERSPFAPRAVSIDQAVKICGVSRASIYRLIDGDKLQTIKVLNRRLILLASIDRLLREGA
jgi:Helix-turn-helix domain